MDRFNTQQCIKKEKLRNTLERIICNKELKYFIQSSTEILKPGFGDIPYLPLIAVDFGPFEPQTTYKEKLVIREDGYYIYAYETFLGVFEEFDECESRFPIGWRLKEARKVNLDEIIELFPNLTSRKFVRELEYQTALRERHIQEFKKYGFTPYHTFTEKLSYHLDRLLSKEIKCLRFLD